MLRVAASGRFDWVRRMGVHEAYHRSAVNRLLHWLCIPLELLAVVALLSLARWGRLDLAMPAIAVVGALYVAAEPFAGLLMTSGLASLHPLAAALSSGRPAIAAAAAIAVFTASFVIQTQVGHGIFERGIDDTRTNVAELRRTGNPIPILLIFFYHLVELLFAAGYRPALRQEMERHRSEELARLGAAGV